MHKALIKTGYKVWNGIATEKNSLWYLFCSPGMGELHYAFQITGAELAQLNVFEENTTAKLCYKAIGFVEDNVLENAFSYKDAIWSRLPYGNCKIMIC